jgi:hypothetical protein
VLDAHRNWVSANFFDVMRMRVIEGRAFTPADDRTDAAPVVVVSERMAKRFWPGEPAVGKRLGYWAGTLTVVGVVADPRDYALAGDNALRFYIPRLARGGTSGSFVLRTSGDPASLSAAVRERVWAIDPELPITSVRPMAERLADSLAEQRYRARLIGAFAALATLFALLGIYGVMSRSVAGRRREMGIRLALGARPPRVVGMIVRQGVKLALGGIVIGVAGAIAATRVLRTFLYGIEPTDITTFAAITIGLASMAVMACLAPSLRASRTDPMLVMRGE